MINIFKFTIFNIFRQKDEKIWPIGNRKRSQTEYSYKDTLKKEFTERMDKKRRGYSF